MSRDKSRFGVLLYKEKAQAKSRILDTANDFSEGKIVRMSGEDEQKILRRSHSYVEGFFVKSDAVAGH